MLRLSIHPIVLLLIVKFPFIHFDSSSFGAAEKLKCVIFRNNLRIYIFRCPRLSSLADSLEVPRSQSYLCVWSISVVSSPQFLFCLLLSIHLNISCFPCSLLLTKCLVFFWVFLQPSQHDFPAVLCLHFYLCIFFSFHRYQRTTGWDGWHWCVTAATICKILLSYVLFLVSSAHYPSYFSTSPLRRTQVKL